MFRRSGRRRGLDIDFRVPFEPPADADHWQLFADIIEAPVSAMRVTIGGTPKCRVDATLSTGVRKRGLRLLDEMKRYAEPEPENVKVDALDATITRRPMHAAIRVQDGHGMLEIWVKNAVPGWEHALRQAGAHVRFYCENTGAWISSPNDRIKTRSTRERLRDGWSQLGLANRIVTYIVGLAIAVGMGWLGGLFGLLRDWLASWLSQRAG